MNSLSQLNVLGVIADVNDDLYTVGTKYGTLNTTYTMNQFRLGSSNKFLHPSDIPDTLVSQATVMRNYFLGIIECSFCRCLKCKTNRYAS